MNDGPMCSGERRLGWFHDGTIHVWCMACAAEVVLPVHLAGVVWIDTGGRDEDGGRYPLIRAEIRAVIERVAAARFRARFELHRPVERPMPRVWFPSARAA